MDLERKISTVILELEPNDTKNHLYHIVFQASNNILEIWMPTFIAFIGSVSSHIHIYIYIESCLS